MRISLLLIAAMLGSMLLGCGSVNNHQATQTRTMNPHDPMMTTRYLNSRMQH